jgi:hypothetical protein
MSCEQNTKIWEAAYERAEQEGYEPHILSEMDLDDVYHYLITGEMNESYNTITYLAYKV